MSEVGQEVINLRQKMYVIVLRSLSPIQQGIQGAHAIVEYAQSFFHTAEYQRWAQVDKTVVILNGGSSIKMKEDMDYLINNQLVDFAFFKEPDLFNGITAFCFLADERIWDRVTYPDRLPPMETNKYGDMNIVLAVHRTFDLEGFKQQIGGEKNFQLMEFLAKFKTV